MRSKSHFDGSVNFFLSLITTSLQGKSKSRNPILMGVLISSRVYLNPPPDVLLSRNPILMGVLISSQRSWEWMPEHLKTRASKSYFDGSVNFFSTQSFSADIAAVASKSHFDGSVNFFTGNSNQRKTRKQKSKSHFDGSVNFFVYPRNRKGIREEDYVEIPF